LNSPLESYGCVAQAKRHSSISKDAKGASEGRLLVINWIHGDLVITGVTIKKAVEGLTGEFLKHLIHEG